jgi:hypothetical protein
MDNKLQLIMTRLDSIVDGLSSVNARVGQLEQKWEESKEGVHVPSAFHPASASSGQRSESSSSDQGSSSSPAGRQGPGLSGNNINSSQGSYMGSRNNTRPIVDKDLHPILNTKFTLDSSNAPKLSKTIMTADEYINWLHKVEDIVHANPRFMSVFNIAAETAWKQCGGERWTKALKDDDVDLLRWESCFLHAQRHLFTFITQLVPEDISRGITLQMKKDRGKYNLPVRLGFRSSVSRDQSCTLSSFPSSSQLHSLSHDAIDDIDLSDSGGTVDAFQGEADDYFSDYSQLHSSSRSVFDTGW